MFNLHQSLLFLFLLFLLTVTVVINIFCILFPLKWTFCVVPPGWRKVISPIPVFLSYSTLSTSPPPVLSLEKLISRRSMILSSDMDENTLKTLSSLLETLRWTYSGDKTTVRENRTVWSEHSTRMGWNLSCSILSPRHLKCTYDSQIITVESKQTWKTLTYIHVLHIFGTVTQIFPVRNINLLIIISINK